MTVKTSTGYKVIPSGTGDFVGPSSSTDNAVVRFDSTTGKLGQNSGLIVNDSVVAALSSDGAVVQQGANSSQNYVWDFKSGSFQLVRTNDQSFFHLEPEINQSATGEYGYTVFRIDAGEISIGLGANYLADWHVGGASKFSVDRAGIVKISGQIQFPATQNPSADVNNLDDYEEGTYNPTITCVTSGTVSLYAVNDTLRYNKIGSLVTVAGVIRVQSVSSPLGILRISLPFTSADLADTAGQSTGVIYVSGSVSANVNGFMPWIPEAVAYMNIYTTASASVGGSAADQMQADTWLYINVSYKSDN